MRSCPKTRTIPSVSVVLPEPLSPQTATINGCRIPMFPCILYRFMRSLSIWPQFSVRSQHRDRCQACTAFLGMCSCLTRDPQYQRALELSPSIAENHLSDYRQILAGFHEKKLPESSKNRYNRRRI